MFPTNDDHQTQDERLDRIGRACLRAASLDEAEVERIASSPFLATRLRARIEAARRAKEESGDWLAIFGVAWRAAPAMCLAAALAIGGLLFAGGNNGDETPTVSGIFTDEALLATSDSTVEDIYFDDASALTQDEVLSTIVNEQERRTQR